MGVHLGESSVAQRTDVQQLLKLEAAVLNRVRQQLGERFQDGL